MRTQLFDAWHKAIDSAISERPLVETWLRDMSPVYFKFPVNSSKVVIVVSFKESIYRDSLERHKEWLEDVFSGHFDDFPVTLTMVVQEPIPDE